jgi:hypothetical protein
MERKRQSIKTERTVEKMAIVYRHEYYKGYEVVETDKGVFVDVPGVRNENMGSWENAMREIDADIAANNGADASLDRLGYFDN